MTILLLTSKAFGRSCLMLKAFLGPSDHHEQSEHNWRFYESIGGKEAFYSDWAMTVVFYAAVHIVQEFLLSKARKPVTHVERQNELRRMHLDQAADTYEELYEASRRTRYDCEKVPQERLSHYEELAKVKLPELLN